MNYADKRFTKWMGSANQEVEWYGFDSLELYQHNLQNNYDKLKNNDWIDKSFTYKFNSHGFRCEEFTDTDSIMFLGCSYTLGVGLPLENIFATIVAQNLNLTCFNLGVGGSSADTGFRLTKIYLQKLKPKIVVSTFLWPHRMELLTTTLAYIHFTPNNLAILNEKNLRKFAPLQMLNDANLRKYYEEFYAKWIEESSNADLNYLKNTLAIAKLCDDLGIKYIDYKSIPDTDAAAVDLDHPCKARDLIHPGIKINQNMAMSILNAIQ